MDPAHDVQRALFIVLGVAVIAGGFVGSSATALLYRLRRRGR